MTRSHSLHGLLGVLIIAAPLYAGEPELSVHVEPAQVKIGQPFAVVLDCVHDHGAAPRFETLELDDLWWQSATRRIVTLPLSDQPGRDLTQVRWQLAGLEPGAHQLELPKAVFATGAAPLRLDLPPAEVEIEAELAEDEDAARDLAGFRPAPEQRPSAVDAAALAVGGLALALLSFVAFMLFTSARARARRRSLVILPPTASELLAAIDASDPQQAREAFALASRATRACIDNLLKHDQSGLTDEEWIASQAGSNRLPASLLEDASALLRSAEQVKYGMVQPTRWAVEEVVKAAQALIEAVEGLADGEASS